MLKDYIQEKRQSKRYLCDEFFTHISLQISEKDMDMTAIDFSREGIGLFSSDTLPESGNALLSLDYQSPPFNHTFSRLPCAIAHCNLTEVGSHCGVYFKLSDLSQADKAALESIESILIENDDPDDRYHLFGDDER